MIKESTHLGICIELLPNNFYKVDLGAKQVICYLSGKMRLNHIRVLVGDGCEVLLDKFGGKTTNRIVRRI
jgi:translation initiation factor IF-1